VKDVNATKMAVSEILQVQPHAFYFREGKKGKKVLTKNCQKALEYFNPLLSKMLQMAIIQND